MGKRFGSLLFLAAVVMFMFCFHGEALAKKDLKGYDTIVVGSVIVKPDAGIPKKYAEDLKDALLRQLQRYNSSHKWGKKVTTTMPSSKGGVVVMEAHITSYAPPSVGRRVGKSFIPGVGEHLGSASVQFTCKFLDGQKGTEVLTQDVNSNSTSANDTVEYAIERGAEYMAKVVHKNR
jgi:hypothetical protein